MEQLKRATVKGLVIHWEKGGIDAVKVYLREHEVFEETWIHKIKTLIEEEHIRSVEEEIRLVSFNLDLKNKLYDNNFKHGYRKDT